MVDIVEKLYCIDYRIIENEKKRVTILCKKKDYAFIVEIFKENGYAKMIHPLSKYHGYRYEYKLSEFLLFYNKDFEIEIFFELPCRSLTPKILIPLDRMIQGNAWQNPVVENGIYYINPRVYIVYIISNEILAKGMFEEKNRKWIVNNKGYLQEEIVYTMLDKVFFKFTDVLIEKIMNEQFAEIYQLYISFDLY